MTLQQKGVEISFLHLHDICAVLPRILTLPFELRLAENNTALYAFVGILLLCSGGLNT